MRNNDSRVRVRIWLPRDMSDVGHASLETFSGGASRNGWYASLWPEEPIVKKAFLESKRAKSHTLQDDLDTEDRSPEVTVDFFSLDVTAINQAYYAADLQDWVLLRTNTSDQNRQNCSGLVMHLLAQGGIDRLIPRTESDLADMGAGLYGGIASGLLTYPLLTLGFPWGWAIYGVGVLGAIALGRAGRNSIADVTVSPTDLAKYILYAKKAEKQKYNNISEDETAVDLSRHKTWFNFYWIDESYYNASRFFSQTTNTSVSSQQETSLQMTLR